MRQNQYLTKTALLIASGVFFLIFSPTFAQTIINSVTTDESSTSTVQTRELIAEPIIRVGLYKTNEAVKFVSDFSYEVWSGEKLRGVIAAGQTTTLSYKNGQYSIKGAGMEFSLFDYFRLIPQEPSIFFTLVSYQRPVAGRKKINFNVYRGTLEFRYSPKSKQSYIINELPLDYYTAGVAETHDSAPIEYIKALMVAVRSYAYSHISKNPPTEKRMFDVYATTVDQIYLGYNSELFMPNVTAAANDTAGQMVTYKGNPVPTPYFSHSNGNTKNWKTKDRPWLKSVIAKYDKGKKMYGHGMGMSNNDAIKRAQKDGWTYDQILQYYYTSTTIEKIY